MSQKIITAVTLLAIFLVIIAAIFTTFQQSEKPEITIVNSKEILREINDTLTSSLYFKNPTANEAKIDDIEISLFYEKEEQPLLTFFREDYERAKGIEFSRVILPGQELKIFKWKILSDGKGPFGEHEIRYKVSYNILGKKEVLTKSLKFNVLKPVQTD